MMRIAPFQATDAKAHIFMAIDCDVDQMIRRGRGLLTSDDNCDSIIERRQKNERLHQQEGADGSKGHGRIEPGL